MDKKIVLVSVLLALVFMLQYALAKDSILIDLSLLIEKDNPFFKEGVVDIARLGHLGTHMDTLGKTPAIEKFISNGKLIDVSNVQNRAIELKDINNGAGIEENDFVIFRTGWLKKTYGTDSYFKESPELSDEVRQLLIKKKVGFIGIDAPGLVRFEKHPDNDMMFLKYNIFIIENMANLEKITKERFKIYCFPLNLDKMSGLPVRVVAELQ